MKFLLILLFSLLLFAENGLPQTKEPNAYVSKMREKYPMYPELDDFTLAKAVKEHDYAGMDEKEFFSKVGLSAEYELSLEKQNKKTDSTLIAVIVAVAVFMLLVLFLVMFQYVFPDSKHLKKFKMIQGFLFGFMFIGGLEVFALMFINYISNSTYAPRGLGWIVLPFIFAFYASNQIKNDEDVFDFKFSFPSIKIFPQTKKGFRIGIVFSMLWVIGCFLITTMGHIGRWRHNDEYLFIFTGILPIVLYWSFYWIKRP